MQSERVAAWRELARRLAHELKNPLFPLQLTVENMIRAKKVSPEMFEEVFAEGATALTDEIDNLKTIIGRFSDFSKMPKPQVSELDMRDVLARVVRLYRPSLEQREASDRNRRRSFRRAAAGLGRCGADASRALESGAECDGRDAGGRDADDRCGARAGAMCAITIADTGQGMTPEECERLFTPYYTTKQQGTGLGLAIVQSVIADHHGTIVVESNPGGGTTFVIDLPAREQRSGDRA